MKVYCSLPLIGIIFVSIACGLRYCQNKDENNESEKVPIQKPTMNLSDYPQPISNQPTEKKDEAQQLKEMP